MVTDRDTTLDYTILMNLVLESPGIKVYDASTDRALKQSILIRANKTHIIINRGREIPIRELGDEGLGNLFRREYRNACRDYER